MEQTTQGRRRRLCVVTGSRAEFDLLRWLMEEIQADDSLQLQVVATGMHLSPEFGLTYRSIEQAGFVIDAKVEMLLSSDTGVGVAKSIGLGVIGFADAFARLAPDVVVVLGDRFETFAAAQAAMVARIPIAHLHGGELTEGAVDEAIRHALTKMSQLHFVAAEPYRRRVIQLGEQPERVFDVGATGADCVRRLSLLGREALEEDLGFCFGRPTFLVTYHPVTLGQVGPRQAVEALFAALDEFPSARILFTKANADAQGREINEQVDAYVAAHPERARAYVSLGQLRYLSAMKWADAVVGNSSSGLLEAPLLKKATVNIGPRQRGRLRAASVIDCAESREEIARALRQALSADFQAALPHLGSPYGDGEASRKVKEHLKQVDLSGLLMKRFKDLDLP